MKLRRLVCTLVVACAIGSPAVADAMLTVGVVEEVTALGQIRLEGRYVPENHEFHQIRIWGIVADPDYLRSLLVGRQIHCWSSGTIMPGESPSIIRMDYSVDVMWCWSRIPVNDIPEEILNREMAAIPESLHGKTKNLGIDLAEYLLKAGHATELCVESFNYFGTCTADIKQ